VGREKTTHRNAVRHRRSDYGLRGREERKRCRSGGDGLGRQKLGESTEWVRWALFSSGMRFGVLSWLKHFDMAGVLPAACQSATNSFGTTLGSSESTPIYIQRVPLPERIQRLGAPSDLDYQNRAFLLLLVVVAAKCDLLRVD